MIRVNLGLGRRTVDSSALSGELDLKKFLDLHSLLTELLEEIHNLLMVVEPADDGPGSPRDGILRQHVGFLEFEIKYWLGIYELKRRIFKLRS